MKKITLVLSIVVIISSAAVSCKKEGPGGKASVSGLVKHHTLPIPHAVVYIKYGAHEFPGSDVSKYDASVTTDASAHYEFKDLEKGYYYLYGVGYDSTILQNVVGGVGVKLKKSETTTTDVPVTE